jgi:hypothetical protein
MTFYGKNDKVRVKSCKKIFKSLIQKHSETVLRHFGAESKPLRALNSKLFDRL